MVPQAPLARRYPQRDERADPGLGGAAHQTVDARVWREGIVPLLQMHDCLDCSVSSREQAELVAQLGREAVKLEVPMRVDLKFGRSWGDAKHTWEELTAGAPKSSSKRSL